MITAFAIVAGLFAGGTGKLVVDVVPSNAIIEVDGKQVRDKTITVRAGKHEIRVRASGHRTKVERVAVKAGRTTKVRIRLARVSGKKVAIGRKPVSRKPAFVPLKRTAKPTKPGRVVVKRPGRKPNARKPGRTAVFVPARGKKPTAKKPGRKPVRTVRTRTVKTKTRKGTKTVKTRTVSSRRPNVRKRPTKRGRATGKRRPAARGARSNGGNARRNRRSSLRPWAVLSFIVGGAAVTGGVIVHGMANDKADEFNSSRNLVEKRKLHEDAKGLDTVSTVLYGTGATFVVLGAVLLASEPSYNASIVPLPEGGAMVGYGGTF